MFWAFYRYIKEKILPLQDADSISYTLERWDNNSSSEEGQQWCKRSSEQKSATGGCKREYIGNNLVQEAGVGDVAKGMMREAERRWQGRSLRTWLVTEGGTSGQ